MLVHRCIEEIKRNSYGVVFILWGLKMDNNEKYYVPDKAFIWNHFSFHFHLMLGDFSLFHWNFEILCKRNRDHTNGWMDNWINGIEKDSVWSHTNGFVQTLKYCKIKILNHHLLARISSFPIMLGNK